MTRVLVIATSPVVRAGLTTLLAGHPELTVLESAAGPSAYNDTGDAVEADVILLAVEPGEDLSLPLNTVPDRATTPIVLLGDEPTAAWAPRAIRGGARGAISRHAPAEQIAAAVIAAAAGLLVREPASVSSTTQAPSTPVSTRTLPALTARETVILDYLAEGLGNKTIAARLGISEHTVKTHVASIFAKLDVSTRAEAVASAARLGLIML